MRARDTLQAVRSDQALSYGNRGMRSTFRNDIGPLYYELADLLLGRADAVGRRRRGWSNTCPTRGRRSSGSASASSRSISRTRASTRCRRSRSTSRASSARITRGNPAVVYIIPLSDRIEILLTTRDGMRRIKSTDVGSAQLTEVVRTFRTQLETRRNHRYLASAKQLYQWLIKPLEAELEAGKIDTLVFVPDGALRTIPMAALHDGKDFLIAKYAVAVSPGLSLSLREEQAEAVSRSAGRVLASGLSESSQGFAALPNVADELAAIEEIYGAKKLLNEDFQVPAFTRELDPTEEYSIVHIASHGVFAADVNDTFVVTFDGSLNLNSLETLLRPYQVQGKPIDLLTLSACQTSAGDDQSALERASLGLGGLAVKAGRAARWPACGSRTTRRPASSSAASTPNSATTPTPARPRRCSRRSSSCIRNEDFSHPIYWAPFLMIGDWL